MPGYLKQVLRANIVFLILARLVILPLLSILGPPDITSGPSFHSPAHLAPACFFSALSPRSSVIHVAKTCVFVCQPPGVEEEQTQTTSSPAPSPPSVWFRKLKSFSVSPRPSHWSPCHPPSSLQHISKTRQQTNKTLNPNVNPIFLPGSRWEWGELLDEEGREQKLNSSMSIDHLCAWHGVSVP